MKVRHWIPGLLTFLRSSRNHLLFVLEWTGFLMSVISDTLAHSDPRPNRMEDEEEESEASSASAAERAAFVSDKSSCDIKL